MNYMRDFYFIEVKLVPLFYLLPFIHPYTLSLPAKQTVGSASDPSFGELGSASESGSINRKVLNTSADLINKGVHEY
jgi:hypothetical protein